MSSQPIIPAPVSIDDAHRILGMIDANPTKAKASITVHELRCLADIIRKYLESQGERPRSEPATPNGYAKFREVIDKLEEDLVAARADFTALEGDAAEVVRAFDRASGDEDRELAEAIETMRAGGRADWWKEG